MGNNENKNWVKFLSFWGLTIASVLFVVNVILGLFNVDVIKQIITVCDLVAKVLLLLAVGVPAYGYVKGKKKAWKWVYWIVLVIYALGVVFHVIF